MLPGIAVRPSVPRGQNDVECLAEHRLSRAFANLEGDVLGDLVATADAQVDASAADQVEHRSPFGEAQGMRE